MASPLPSPGHNIDHKFNSQKQIIKKKEKENDPNKLKRN